MGRSPCQRYRYAEDGVRSKAVFCYRFPFNSISSLPSLLGSTDQWITAYPNVGLIYHSQETRGLGRLVEVSDFGFLPYLFQLRRGVEWQFWNVGDSIIVCVVDQTAIHIDRKPD